jgi:hypothetical protein
LRGSLQHQDKTDHHGKCDLLTIHFHVSQIAILTIPFKDFALLLFLFKKANQATGKLVARNSPNRESHAAITSRAWI